ncbi:cytochrome P450 [Kitasatospora sp. NPDC056783]|uniref:cytochrome P450 n=1 Tax=Kitasatospora sp. NPDC056783 TaxID=3345943 RepID=UPI0036B4E67D
MAETIVYDPLDPAVLTDPYPLYAELRDQTPVFWNERMQSWVATRYDDCREVLRNHQTFARDRRRVNIDVPEFAQNLQSLDPPQHAPLRSLLMNAFRAQDLDAAAHRTHDKILGLFQDLSDLDEFDWIHEVAAPVALNLTAELFGVVEPDLKHYAALADAITRRMDAGLDPTVIEPGDEARKQLNTLADGWFAENSGRPGLMTTIKQLMDGATVPEHYIGNSIAAIFNASYGTVFAAAGNAVLTLLQHRGTLDRFRDRGVVDTGVEELIRFDGPAQGTSRIAAERTVLGGQVIEAGRPVITLLAAANRDPAQFERPDELVLDRSPNRHLGFGWGPHACLGATFGHVAIKEIVLCLLEAPSLRLTGTPVRRRTATVRSMDLLPVSFRK